MLREKQKEIRKTQYGYVTCGHGCKDSIDKRIYASSKTGAEAKGIICDPTYSGSVDASYIKRVNKEIKIGAKTFYDASGGRNGDKLKTNVYKRGLAQNTVVYKCGVTTYKTSSCVSSQRFTKTLNGVKFINLTKVNSAFCQGGDSGGIVYTYQDNEYWPCGIVKGHGGSGADGYAFFFKASEIANVLNVEPYQGNTKSQEGNYGQEKISSSMDTVWHYGDCLCYPCFSYCSSRWECQ